jgi:predicted ATPase
MARSPNRQWYYSKHISDALNSEEWSKIVDLIPDITRLVDKEDKGNPPVLAVSSMGGRGFSHHSKEDLEQLKFTIRASVRTIATADTLVVLFLDDVQWVDDLTLDLVQSTLLDDELKHLVLVASFCTNEVYCDDQEENGPPHKVVKLIQTLKKSSKGSEVQEMT